MRTLRFLLTLVLVLVVATPLLAGEGKKKKAAKPKAPPVFMPAQFLEGLKLTDDQKEKVEKIKQEFTPKLDELRKKMTEVLTPEQRKAEQEARKNAKQAGKKGKEAEDMVREAVKPTDEQQQKLDSLRKEMGALMKEIRGKLMDLLTDDQKAELKAKAKEKKNK
jgi:Spy/CpxP family protein refolding chaperone